MNTLEALLDLLNDLSLSDILEMCDISEEDVLIILYRGGHIDIPPFLEGPNYELED